MSAKTKLRVGLVGYGFMGRTHSNAFAKVNQFFDLKYQPVLAAVCARDASKVDAFAAQWGFESAETDWRKLVARPDIDLIDIASPNDTHAEIATAAAQAGKMVMCEKPLGRNSAESEQMVKAVEAAKVPNMVWYNYRRVPAVTLAKHLIDEGRLGQVFHYRAKFLQDWTISKDLPQGGAGLWRLDVNVAGSGVTGDLLAHCIDSAIWMNGGIDRVSGMTETFIKERHHSITGKMERSASTTQARFWRDSRTARSGFSRRRAMRAATRRSIPWRSTANMRRSCGICMTSIACNISIIATRESCAAGGLFTSPTASILI
jgi:predicted dehydrogenase